MRKLFCIILCLCFLCGMLVSCDGDDNQSKDTGTENTSTASNNELQTSNYVADLPEFKWDVSNEEYATFDVLVYSNEIQTTYFSEEIGYDMYDTTDEVLNDAVRDRNNHVHELTGSKITAHAVKDVAETLRLDVQGGSGEYDAAMPYMSSGVSMAQEGMLCDLTTYSDYIDLSKAWWDQNATETFSINNKVYFTTGDISIMHKIVSGAISFNKKMYADLFPGEKTLYDMVDDGTWTFDKMIELAKAATKDNGDGVWDYNDTWGFNGSYGTAVGLYFGFGQTYSAKDDNDIPTLTLFSENSITSAQNILEALTGNNEWIIYAEKFGTENIWDTSVKVFGENRALFMGTAFSAIKKFRKYEELDFGIVPEPKANENQEKYCTPCAANYAYGIVIPITAYDPKFSAYMIELTCCEGKNYIADAWYETILKTRDMVDNESAEMVDLIFDNVIYDTASVYNIAGVSNMLYDLVKNKSTDITSSLEAIKGSAEASINKIVTDYESNE